MICDEYALLKNVGYDIKNSDDLFKLICDNPRNEAKYFDILKVTTDFDIEGIAPGEKYFYVCRKKVQE